MKSWPSLDMAATGNNIEKLRRTAGISVHELQKMLGLSSTQAIYKWQNGTSLPSVDNLLALSVLLEVPIDSILVTTRPSAATPTDREPDGSVFLFLAHIIKVIVRSGRSPQAAV